MEANLKGVTAAAFKASREAGLQVDTSELAYAAVLIDQRCAWRLSSGASSGGGGDSGAASPALDPTTGLLATPGLGKELLCQMGQHVAAQVTQMGPGEMAVMRLQIAVASAQEQQAALLQCEQSARAARVASLARRAASVCAAAASGDGAAPASTKDYEKAFDAALDYVIEAAGLAAAAPGTGPAAAAAQRAEASAALDSAFPLSAVARWVTLPPAERLQQLQPLARLTLGICLYNASPAAGRAPSGGSGGVSAGSRRGSGAGSRRASASASAGGGGGVRGGSGGGGPLAAGEAMQLQMGARLAETLTAAEAAAAAAFTRANRRSRAGADGEGGAEEEGRGGWEALFCAQAATSLRLMAADARDGLAACRELGGALEGELGELRRLVGGSAAVSKDSVFPRFERAGALRLALSEELRMLVVRERIFEATAAALRRAATDAGFPNLLAAPPAPASRQQPVPVGGAASAEAVEQLAGSCQAAGLDYVPPEKLADAAAEAAARGLAVLGSSHPSRGQLQEEQQQQQQQLPRADGDQRRSRQPSAGRQQRPSADAGAAAALAFNGWHQAALYGFSSAEAASAFAASPAAALDALRRAAAAQPLLQHLFALSSPPPGEAAAETAPRAAGSAAGRGWAAPPLRWVLGVAAARLQVEAGTQTPTHFVECFVSRDYEWNEWALRRRVIALANLRSKATHSAQTLLSHFRAEGTTQTWAPKGAASQTPHHKGQAMPRKLRYVAGLRGAPAAARMRVVSLELDLGQPHQF